MACYNNNENFVGTMVSLEMHVLLYLLLEAGNHMILYKTHKQAGVVEINSCVIYGSTNARFGINLWEIVTSHSYLEQLLLVLVAINTACY